MAGKGDKERPMNITRKEYGDNWDNIFKKDIMKKGDKVLYDSGFGYDVGEFVKNVPEDNFFLYPQVTVKLPIVNGSLAEGLVDKSCIYPYSEELESELQEKYEWED